MLHPSQQHFAKLLCCHLHLSQMFMFHRMDLLKTVDSQSAYLAKPVQHERFVLFKCLLWFCAFSVLFRCFFLVLFGAG